MGKVDIAAKNYMGGAEIFADAFNYYIYGGRKVLDPERLWSLDPEEIGILNGSYGAGTPELIQNIGTFLSWPAL